jgi:hypothetical protein
MDEACHLYRAAEPSAASHLALRLKGWTRYTVPLDGRAQKACWKLFHPGRIELPLRAMAQLPGLFGAVRSQENEKMALLRAALGGETGVSCCKAGVPGPWSKETVLFLDQAAEPKLVVKAGVGESVDGLLRNEAQWLRALRDQPMLADNVADLVAHQSGKDFCFVAQSVLPGNPEFQFGELHFSFLKEFHAFSRRRLRYEESGLFHNMQARMKELDGLLTEDWSRRIEKAMRRVEEAISGEPILMTAAHNDFAPWNIRVEGQVARVFDWEYAEQEQLPLFDPLHFALMPMALKRKSSAKMMRRMRQTLESCTTGLGQEECHAAETQALAYLTNLCTLYLCFMRGRSYTHAVLNSYAPIIDCLCRL